jgi:hypothetical protein
MFERATAFLRAFTRPRKSIRVGDRVEVLTPWSCWKGYTGIVVAIEMYQGRPSVYWVHIPMVLNLTFPQSFQGYELTRVGML